MAFDTNLRRSLRMKLVFLAILGCSFPLSVQAVDLVSVNRAGTKTDLEGRIEVEAQDGGVLLLGRDGVLWPLPKEEIAPRRKDDKPFKPLTREELTKKLASDFPGFR